MKLISNNQREARELYLDPLRVWVYANIKAYHPDTFKIRCWAAMGALGDRTKGIWSQGQCELEMLRKS